MVAKKGSWYYYGEQRMAQGRDKTLLELAASAPLAECARTFRLEIRFQVLGNPAPMPGLESCLHSEEARA